jgi:hypothetical protein
LEFSEHQLQVSEEEALRHDHSWSKGFPHRWMVRRRALAPPAASNLHQLSAECIITIPIYVIRVDSSRKCKMWFRKRRIRVSSTQRISDSHDRTTTTTFPTPSNRMVAGRTCVIFFCALTWLWLVDELDWNGPLAIETRLQRCLVTDGCRARLLLKLAWNSNKNWAFRHLFYKILSKFRLKSANYSSHTWSTTYNLIFLFYGKKVWRFLYFF